MTLRRISDPGKFEGELVVSQMLWDLVVLQGCADDFVSAEDGDGAGSYTLVRPCEGVYLFDDGTLTDGDKEFLAAHINGGCILRESEQGFVEAAWYDNAEDLQAVWDDVCLERDSDSNND